MLDTLRTQTTDPTDREAIDRTRAAVDAADCGAAPRIDEHDLLTVAGHLPNPELRPAPAAPAA